MQYTFALLPSVICLVGSHFSTLCHKRHDFLGGKNIAHKIIVLIFSKSLSETFVILRSIEQGMIKMCISLHVKYPLFLSDFNEN